MKKIINFRLTLTLIIGMLLSVVMFTYIFVMQKAKIIAFISLIFILFAFLILSIIFKRKVLYVLVAVIFFMCVPALMIYLKSNAILKNEKFDNKFVSIEGRLSKNYRESSNGNIELILDNVTVDDEKISGCVSVFVKPDNLDVSKFDVGRYFKIDANVYVFTLQDENLSRSISYLTNDIVMIGYAMFYNVELTNKIELSFKDKIKTFVFDKLCDSEMKHSDVAYAMLFGDSSYLNLDVKDSFRATGIAHLLAVSGLHVSIIVLLINFILRKFKVNIKLNMLFSLCFLTIYAYFCDFSISVIRASLMALFSLYAVYRGKVYDNLSVLSMVAILILLFNPLEMFNISFVLSFSAVLSIILLMKPFERLFSKIFYNKLSSIIALNVSVQIGLLAANLYYFGRYPVLGIFANLICVPIATMAFMILFIATILVLIMPFMSFTLHGFGMLMDIVVKFNYFIGGLGVNFISSLPVLAIPLMFLTMFIASDYLFVKKRYKVLTCSILAVIVSILLVM